MDEQDDSKQCEHLLSSHKPEWCYLLATPVEIWKITWQLDLNKLFTQNNLKKERRTFFYPVHSLGAYTMAIWRFSSLHPIHCTHFLNTLECIPLSAYRQLKAIALASQPTTKWLRIAKCDRKRKSLTTIHNGNMTLLFSSSHPIVRTFSKRECIFVSISSAQSNCFD